MLAIWLIDPAVDQLIMAREDRAVAKSMVFIPFAYVEANMLTNPVVDPFGKILNSNLRRAVLLPVGAAAAGQDLKASDQHQAISHQSPACCLMMARNGSRSNKSKENVKFYSFHLFTFFWFV